ncbi:phage protein, partial [Escherichia coli]
NSGYLRVDVYQGQNGQSITLELLNAKIGFATSGNSPQQQSSNQQNTPVYDDSIPF